MTTKHSPLSVLKAQADRIAMVLKAAERGETIAVHDPAGKIAAARATDGVTVGVVMDDKILKIEITWAKVREMSESSISAWVVKHMREQREDA